jgi:23S rRNA pseudouridine1911/1915/1917 synthase
MLHSFKLEFKHPITGKEMLLEAPLPQYFEDVLNTLRT